MDVRAFGKLLAPFMRRLDNAIARGVLLAVASGKMQVLQLRVLAGEVADGVEHFEGYGFTSHPHPGAEAIVLAIGADSSHRIALTVADRRYRLEVDEGEVAIFDDLGQKVHLKRNGIVAEGLNVYLKSEGVIRIEGDGVEIHGRQYVQTDVVGLGERRTHTGGSAYQDDTYTTGAVVTSTEHGLDQPDLPSDHPEGP